MGEISVRRTNEDENALVFDVEIAESGSSTTHEVTLQTADHERLAADAETPEAFVERCFEFLLAREPKESILARFDIAQIGNYFPEFEDEI
jgi:hypothetical protein